ncbi:D-alanyl-D-alanine-carboxypeptidase/endopeptidase AmpH precursor [compost metagenome]
MLAALAALAACGTLSRMEIDSDQASGERYAVSGDLRKEVDALAQPLIDKGATPGVVVGVLLPDGSVKCYGYGTTEHAVSGHRPDGDTLFAVGSISKGFLSATTAVLVQQGVFAWDDTLERLLPPGTPLSASARKITLLQLVTHTSGLPRQPFTPQTLLYFVEYLFTGESFYRHFDRDYLLAYLADFDAPATTAPNYSNIGYGLLGHVLELRTGKKMDALVSETILQPLALDSTGYHPQGLPGFAARAHGHVGDQPKFMRRGSEAPDWEFTDVLTGSAALYSTANDLLRYARANIRGSDDPVLDRALHDTLSVRVDRPVEAAALAWLVDDIDGNKITYQVGFVAGYSSYIGLDVKNRTGVVVLQNSFNWTNSIGHRLLLRISKRKHISA